MVVQDLEDDCRTLLAPARMMEDIYRIWCETHSHKANDEDPYDSYFDNEYKEYVSEAFDFSDYNEEDGVRICEWEVDDGAAFDVDLPDNPSEEDVKSILGEYYVSVFRTEDGDI